MVNSYIIFEINGGEFLLTVLESEETRSRVFFHFRDFYRGMETLNCSSTRSPLKHTKSIFIKSFMLCVIKALDDRDD